MPPRRWVLPGLLGRIGRGLLTALVGAGVSGCGMEPPSPEAQGRTLRGTVVMAMGITSDETIDGELSEGLKSRLASTLREFRLMHPHAHVQLQLFPEHELLEQTRFRTAAGLSPDLLFISNSTASDLQRAGLIRSVRMPPTLLARMDPAEARRFQGPNGELTSVPVLLMPQLACFDRRRLARSPATLDALLQESGQGLRVGLPLDGFNLAWTFGSLGVVESVEQLFAGQPATDERRQALGRWLSWLQQADQTQDVNFQLSQSQLIHDLGQGQLDWTSCRSTHLARLKNDLGRHLGIATLPWGPGGPPSPLSRQRVLAFGRNSSPSQRQVAEALARFLLTPLTQRNLAVQKQEVLPVLDAQRLPTNRKGTLRLLALAQNQMRGGQDTLQNLFPTGDHNGQAMGQVLSRYLYGDLTLEGAIDGLVGAIQDRRRAP
ncbi:MAG: extracellular solute-binding protein [Cyanobacteriota bacterium]|nr:extracellular solute-binding protein [Cyanobacteriota bacterium]